MVSCEIVPSGSLYREEDPLEALLGRTRRHAEASPAMKALDEKMDKYKPVFVGIRFKFRLRALVPAIDGAEARDLGFSMEAQPSPNFKVEGRPGAFRAEPETVYDGMADSACAEFSRELARRFGAGVPPAAEDEK